MTEDEKWARFVRPEVRRGLERRRLVAKDLPWDVLITTDRPLLRGMRLEKFKEGKYTAYFIYGWHVSSEAWRKEIEEIVGPPKGK
jgi:hypothetical protein